MGLLPSELFKNMLDHIPCSTMWSPFPHCWYLCCVEAGISKWLCTSDLRTTSVKWWYTGSTYSYSLLLKWHPLQNKCKNEGWILPSTLCADSEIASQWKCQKLLKDHHSIFRKHPLHCFCSYTIPRLTPFSSLQCSQSLSGVCRKQRVGNNMWKSSQKNRRWTNWGHRLSNVWYVCKGKINKQVRIMHGHGLKCTSSTRIACANWQTFSNPSYMSMT